MNKKNTKELILKYMPFVILAIALWRFHMTMGLYGGDDVWFKEEIHTPGFQLFTWLKNRYIVWSSRSLIEMVMLIFYMLPQKIWKLTDLLLMMTSVIFLSKIFCTEKNSLFKNTVIVLLCFTVRVGVMGEAGWGATTMNYAWPLACGVVAIYPIRKLMEKRTLYKWEYILYSGFLIFAANQEQLCIVLLLVYGVANVIYYHRERAVHKYLMVQLAFVFVDLTYIILCPGNRWRGLVEIQQWLPEFAQYTVLEKATLGILNTFNVVFLREDIWLVSFPLILFIAIWSKRKEWWCRIFALVPVAILESLKWTMRFWGKKAYPFLLSKKLEKMGIKEFVKSGDMVVYLGLTLLCCMFLINFYLLYGKSYQMLISTGCLLLGLMTKAMLGFSPTIWESGDRTGWILMYALIGCSVQILDEFDDSASWVKGLILIIAFPTGRLLMAI